ncbi:MAG: hypothetical protein NVS1B10_06990 [Candidatus Saccharimonadales bacterium]
MAAVNQQNPGQNIMGGVMDAADLAQSMAGGQGGTDSSSNPFIMNPQNGQFVTNPGFMNAMQQFQLKLLSNPSFAAHMEAELANLKQMESIVPTSELQNYRDSSGNNLPFGTTGQQLSSSGLTPVSPAQNEEANQLHNALDALSKAYSASKGINSVTGSIGGVLQRTGIGASLANLIPGYQQYQSAVSALPQNVAGLNLQSLFQTPGVVPEEGVKSAQTQLQGYLNSLQPGRYNNPTPQASPLPPSAVSPVPSVPMNPYDITANPVSNPQQLGANARKSIGM